MYNIKRLCDKKGFVQKPYAKVDSFIRVASVKEINQHKKED